MRRVKVKRSLHELSTCWHLEILDPDGNVVILHKRKDGTYEPRVWGPSREEEPLF